MLSKSGNCTSGLQNVRIIRKIYILVNQIYLTCVCIAIKYETAEVNVIHLPVQQMENAHPVHDFQRKIFNLKNN